MASALCEVSVAGGAYQTTENGIDADAGDTVIIRLASDAGVLAWQLTCTNTDETTSAAAINAAIVYDYVLKTATFTAPAAGKSLLFESTVTSSGAAPTSETLGVFMPVGGVGGTRVLAAGMVFEPDSVFGWIQVLNDAIRGSGGAAAETPLAEAGAGPFNNYDTGDSTVIECTGNASITFTGFVAPIGGATKRITVIADSGFTITFTAASGSSSAANRIYLGGFGASLTTNTATFVYSPNRALWVLESYPV